MVKRRKRDPQFKKMVGERLAEARKAAGVGQKVVGIRTGVDTATVGCWEIGENSPALQDLPVFVEMLGRSANYFVGLPDPRGLEPDEETLVSFYRKIPREESKKLAVEFVRNMATRYSGETEKEHVEESAARG